MHPSNYWSNRQIVAKSIENLNSTESHDHIQNIAPNDWRIKDLFQNIYEIVIKIHYDV